MWIEIEKNNFVMDIGGNRLLLKTIDVREEKQRYSSNSSAMGTQVSMSSQVIELCNVKLIEEPSRVFNGYNYVDKKIKKIVSL